MSNEWTESMHGVMAMFLAQFCRDAGKRDFRQRILDACAAGGGTSWETCAGMLRDDGTEAVVTITVSVR